MKRINALQLRQGFGKVLAELERRGEPIVIEKGRRPRAVLITLADFERRFVEVEAAARRQEIARQVRADRRRAPGPGVISLLRELRGPLS